MFKSYDRHAVDRVIIEINELIWEEIEKLKVIIDSTEGFKNKLPYINMMLVLSRISVKLLKMEMLK